MAKLVMHVGTEAFSGWKSIDVTCSLNAAADQFDIATKVNAPLPISEGSPVQLRYGGQLLLTGFVDDVVDDYDASRWDQSIKGRSRLMDLVDCSTEGKDFAPQSFYAIAETLLKPFGIKVEPFVALDNFKYRKPLAAGETIWEFLERLSRYAAVLLYGNPEGNLVVARRGDELTAGALVLGHNVLAARRTRSASQRFGEYIVTGTGDLGWDDAKAAASKRGVAKDVRVTRHRPVVITQESSSDNRSCEQQAKWYSNQRFAQSRPITYVVGDWLDDNGLLYRPNRLIPVRDARLKIDKQLLITEVRYLLDDEGTRCEITVQPPEGFDLVAVPEPKGDGLQWD